MPKELEDKMKREAAKHKDWSQEHKNALIYGTLRKTGWKPERERGGHGSLEDITVLEDATEGCSEVFMDEFRPHPVHSGYKSGNGRDKTPSDTGDMIAWGSDEFKHSDIGDVGDDGPGNVSALRDIGNGVHMGAPIDYFGPDTAYRAEEIDVHQYGWSYDPYPFKDFYKTEDKQFERTFRVREQDEYDSIPQPGTVTDSIPHTEAYGAVNHEGAGPEREWPDRRSFESQRQFARTNKERSMENTVDVSDLDTKESEDIR